MSQTQRSDSFLIGRIYEGSFCIHQGGENCYFYGRESLAKGTNKTSGCFGVANYRQTVEDAKEIFKINDPEQLENITTPDGLQVQVEREEGQAFVITRATAAGKMDKYLCRRLLNAFAAGFGATLTLRVVETFPEMPLGYLTD